MASTDKDTKSQTTKNKPEEAAKTQASETKATAKAAEPVEQPKPAEPTEAEKQAQKEQAAKREADSEAQSTADENAEAAIAPAIEGVEDQPEVKARVRQTLAHTNATPKPTMVNGKSVAGKVYDEESEEWVDDPDAAGSSVRPSDIFDRIGEAFPHEAQRLVIEELARLAGADEDSTDLPEGMPAVKSTASLRTDVSGHGRFTGGGPGVKPLAVGADGKAQAE